MRGFIIGLVSGACVVAAIAILLGFWPLSGMDRAWWTFELSDRAAVPLMRALKPLPDQVKLDSRKAFDYLVAAGELEAVNLPDTVSENLNSWFIENDVRLFLPLDQKLGGQRAGNTFYFRKADVGIAKSRLLAEKQRIRPITPR